MLDRHWAALCKKLDFLYKVDIMSNVDKKLDRNQARKRIACIVNNTPELLRFSRHALEELKSDKLTTVDVLNVMKSSDAQIVDEPEFENGSYRYRLGTKKIMVVVAFDSPKSLVVVTAWRKL